jgi:hypothetical protein
VLSIVACGFLEVGPIRYQVYDCVDIVKIPAGRHKFAEPADLASQLVDLAVVLQISGWSCRQIGSQQEASARRTVGRCHTLALSP